MPSRGWPTRMLAGLTAGLVASALGAGESNFEPVPLQLATKNVVRAELLEGEHYRLADEVENDGFMNRYRIESDFGAFEAEGTMQLRTRIREIGAIAELREITRSEAFAEAMGRSLTQTAESAVGAVQHPVRTAKGVPGGVKRFVKRTARKASDVKETVGEELGGSQKAAGSEAGEAAATDESESDESSATAGGEASEGGAKGVDASRKYAKRWLGYTGARRHLAEELKVDPYSDNELLDKELDRVAQASAAGGLAVRFSPVPRWGVVGAIADVSELVYEMDPLDLRLRDERILRDLGISDDTVESLFENPYQTPTTATLLTDVLQRLEGVEGLTYIVEEGGEAESRAEVELLVRSTNFLAEYHRNVHPLVRVDVRGNFPYGVAADGRVAVVAAVDYLSWTEDLAELVARATPRLQEHTGATIVEAWIEGGCSPLAKAGLREHGYEVHASAFDGLRVVFD